MDRQPELEALRVSLESPIASTRREAVGKLVQLFTASGLKDAEIEVLLNKTAQHDDDPEVRDTARLALLTAGSAPSTPSPESDTPSKNEKRARFRAGLLRYVAVFIIGIVGGIATYTLLNLAQVRYVLNPPCIMAAQMISVSGDMAMFQNTNRNNTARTLIKIDGNEQEIVRKKGRVSSLALAPDHIRVLEARDENISPYQFIYEWRLDGDPVQSERMLTYGTLPSWSPDMKQVAFMRQGNTIFSSLSLYVINTDGSGGRRIYSSTALVQSSASWSPDGKQLVVGSVDDKMGSAIIVIGADGSEPKPIVTGDMTYVSPAWSPDGKWIVYLANTLHVVSPDGSGDRVLPTLKDVSVASPAWSPDSQLILYVARENNGRQTIRTINLDGTGDHEIYNFCAH